MNNVLGDNIGSVNLVQHVGDDAGIVNAARVSLGKESDALKIDLDEALIYATMKVAEMEKIKAVQNKDRKLIKYLLENHHGTPFEHNSLTFCVKAPIFIARQLMRHRIASFNEISGRYVEAKKEFYIPAKFRKQSANNRQASVDEFVEEAMPHNYYHEAVETAFGIYEKLLEAGVCREQARAVLPLATYTEFYFTCNLRSFLHFIELRLHEGAQWEIQQYAKAMLDQVVSVFPETIKIWKELKK